MKDLSQDLIDALLGNNAKIETKFLVNFNDNDIFEAEEELSKYLESAKISKKIEGNLGTSVTDKGTFTLDNSDNRFSPKNLSSQWSGNVVPKRYSRFEAGANGKGTAMLFDGILESIQPSYNNKSVTFKIEDYTNQLKNIKCPDKFYEDKYIEDIVIDLLEYAGVNFTEDSISKTNVRTSAYFEGQTVWSAIQTLAQSVWARVYVENKILYFETRLSPDYNEETNVVETFDKDKWFNIKETYNSKDLYNEVKVTSSPYKQQQEQVVWRASSEPTEASEQYNISDINTDNQLQLTETVDGTTVNTTNLPLVAGAIMVIDKATGLEYTEGNAGISVEYDTGVITFNDTTSHPLPTGEGILDVKYKFHFNILEPNASRDFIIHLDNPTTELTNIHVDLENLTDGVELIAVPNGRTVKLNKNQSKKINILEPHDISWSLEDDRGNILKSGTHSITDAETGKYTIKTKGTRSYFDILFGREMDYEFDVVAQDGSVLISDSYNVNMDWNDLTGGFPRVPQDIVLKFSYNHYDYTQVENNLNTSHLSIKTELEPNQKDIHVELENLTDKRVQLHGYLKDKEDTIGDMILFGKPYKQNNTIEITKTNEDSVNSFGLNTLSNIENKHLATINDVEQLVDYLLYQYSTPMTELEIETKPMPHLELMDKVKVIQDDRDIDDEFFIREIKYNYSKSKGFTMNLRLRQAYQSNFVYSSDGSYSVVGNGGESEDTNKPTAINEINASIVSASKYGDNRVRISWINNHEYNITHYNIYKKSPSDTMFVYEGEVKKGSKQYVDSTVGYNQTYEYKISLVNEAGIESDLSNSVSVTTKLGDQPPAPTLSDSIFTDEVYLEWLEVDEADRYELRNDTNFGVNDGALLYRGQEVSTVVNNPTARNVTYYLKSINDNNNYSASYATISIENTAPPKPTAPQVLEFFEGLWVDIQLVSDSDLEGYNLYITNLETNNTDVISLSTAQKYSYSADPKQDYEIQVSAYDSFGEGALSNKVTATTKSIEDINQFGLSFQPPRVVDTKPTLPNTSFPQGSTIYLTTDSTLYKNIGGSWSTKLSDNEYQKLLVGTIEAGAIGVDQLQANSTTADKVGTNEIITDLANIKDAVIDELKVGEVTADMVTVGSASNFEDGYDPTIVKQETIDYANSVSKAKDKMRLKPEGAYLWHFDGNITSTDGTIAEVN